MGPGEGPRLRLLRAGPRKAHVCRRADDRGRLPSLQQRCAQPADQRAEEWWDRNVRNFATELHADEPILGRWLAKVAFNMQRIEKREGSLGPEPRFPDDGIRWIIGADKLHDSVGIVVGALPAGHDAGFNAGHDGPPRGTAIPLRITHLLGLVFMTVWRAPIWDVSVAGMTKAICDTMPGVALDLERGRGPRQVPIITRPDFVEKGLYGNLELMNALHDHWKREAPNRSP